MQSLRIKKGRFAGETRVRGEERLRTRRRRMRRMAFASGALVAFVMLGVVAWASYQPRFQIAQIVPTGQAALSAAMLEASASTTLGGSGFHLFSKNSIVFYPKQALTAALLATFPRLKSVDAQASLGTQTLTLNVVERTPYATWCRDADCYLLDEQGYIFAPHAGETLARTETYTGGLIGDPIGQHFLPTYFTSVAAVVDAVQQAGIAVKGVEVVNDHDYRITDAHGMALLIHFTDNALTIASNLKAALSADALAGKLDTVDYIDLRFGDRVYYKYRPK